MPQHKSAKKRMKTGLKSMMRNRAARRSLKTALKEYRALPQEQKKEKFSTVQALLDKAAGRGFIHKRKADRLKSRLRP